MADIWKYEDKTLLPVVYDSKTKEIRPKKWDEKLPCEHCDSCGKEALEAIAMPPKKLQDDYFQLLREVKALQEKYCDCICSGDPVPVIECPKYSITSVLMRSEYYDWEQDRQVINFETFSFEDAVSRGFIYKDTIVWDSAYFYVDRYEYDPGTEIYTQWSVDAISIAGIPPEWMQGDITTAIQNAFEIWSPTSTGYNLVEEGDVFDGFDPVFIPFVFSWNGSILTMNINYTGDDSEEFPSAIFMGNTVLTPKLTETQCHPIFISKGVNVGS